MKIVIDIPEEWEKRIEHNQRPNSMESVDLVMSIWQGKILPKGHGDLIDRNYLLDCSYKIDSKYCEYDEVVKASDIKDAKVILEADKEEEK